MSRAIREKLGWGYKKDAGCHRARRRREKCFQRASKRGRSEALCLCGRDFDERRFHPTLRKVAKWKEGTREGAEELGQENVTLISSIAVEGM